MVLAVEKEGKDVISSQDIKYTLLSGYVYEIPFFIELGVVDHYLDEDKFEIGDPYTIITRYAERIDLVLSDIIPYTNRVTGKGYTAYVFMHQESYYLKYNKYQPTNKVFGVPLSKYIIGSKNQMKIAILELRKKGLYLAIDDKYKIKQKHVKEYENEEHKYVLGQIAAGKVRTNSIRQNYASIETSGTTADTKRGGDTARYLPEITQNEIKSLNLFVEPKYIIQSNHENATLLLGAEATYKQKKYCVMEKHTFFYKNSVRSVITLGGL